MDKKKTVLATYTLSELMPKEIIENGTDTAYTISVSMTLALGSHQIGVRPYAIAGNGLSMKGNYCLKSGRVNVSVPWRKVKPKLTVQRTDENAVTLKWTPISDAVSIMVFE